MANLAHILRGHVFFSVVGSLFLIIYVQEMYFYLVGYLAFSLLNDRNRTNCIILAPKFCLHAKSRPVKITVWYKLN